MKELRDSSASYLGSEIRPGMATNLNRNGQRIKTMAFIKKAPQRPAGDNSLHIYYGDSWLPLISPLRSLAFPGALATAQTKTRSSSLTVASTYTPNFSRPQKSITYQSLSKLPNVLHKHRAAGMMTAVTAAGAGATTTTTTTTIARRKPHLLHHHRQHDTVQVWDSSRADHEHGSGLQIRRLAGGLGIAVRGVYADRPRAGPQPARPDAFLAHLVEGRMEETMQTLVAQVEEARRRWGLRDLATDVCYRDDQTLEQDPGMLWNSHMVAAERRLNDRFIGRVEELWGGTPRLHPYHVCGDQVGMCISAGFADGRPGSRVVSVMNI